MHSAAKKSKLSPSAGNAVSKKRPAKVAVKHKAHALLWVPHNGTKSKTWPKLKVIGVYANKDRAVQAREKIINERPDEQYGHGDICVGGTWDDEVDLVIKPVLNADDDHYDEN